MADSDWTTEDVFEVRRRESLKRAGGKVDVEGSLNVYLVKGAYITSVVVLAEQFIKSPPHKLNPRLSVQENKLKERFLFVFHRDISNIVVWISITIKQGYRRLLHGERAPRPKFNAWHLAGGLREDRKENIIPAL